MTIRRLNLIAASISVALTSACRPTPTTVPSTLVTAPIMARTKDMARSAGPDEQQVISLAKWSPKGQHEWSVTPACQKDQGLNGDAKLIKEIAETYLAKKHLLPARYHFCVSRLDSENWQATCMPSREYLNSPVTVIVSAGKVMEYYFTDAADPVAGMGTSSLPELSDDFPRDGPFSIDTPSTQKSVGPMP